MFPARANAELAAAAAYERDVLEKNMPAMIEAGRITPDDAAAAIAAWRTIAALVESGSTETDLSFADLHLYTSRCLIGLEEAVTKAEGGEARILVHLIRRRDLVAVLHAQIERNRFHADHLAETNLILRRRAAAERKVA